jgi:hypothetical protein
VSLAYVQDSAAGIGGILSKSLWPTPTTVSVTAALVHTHSGLDDGTAKPDSTAVTMVMGASGELSDLGQPTKEPEAGVLKNMLRRVNEALEELGLIRKASAVDAPLEARLLRRRAAQRRIMTCCGVCAEG